jgi:hypothetical protein
VAGARPAAAQKADPPAASKLRSRIKAKYLEKRDRVPAPHKGLSTGPSTGIQESTSAFLQIFDDAHFSSRLRV